jgi:16S rRNA (cytosine967-C5)-methyltransferase
VTPAARVQAQIEVLDSILSGRVPADRVLGDYLRARRYIGSKDRRAIQDSVYGVLRNLAKLTWWCVRSGREAPDARALVLAAQALLARLDAAQIAALLDGGPYSPAPLSESEVASLAVLAGQDLDSPEQDAATRLEVPAWLLPRLEVAFGEALEVELRALNRDALVDIRVNSLVGDLEAARESLASEGIEAVPVPGVPLALRLTARRPVKATEAFRAGMVEIQDAGSQIAAQLCGARPGMAVADFCAGGGGKTLALAAAMQNRGRLVALDVAQSRLDRSAARLRRAGVSIVERRVLPDVDWLRGQAARFDLVLVDAPCSGSGAWRRDPYARWQLDEEQLARYAQAQADSLEQAAGLVRPGGRLVYVTCSLLPEENEVRIQAFQQAHDGFSVVPAAEAWTVAGLPMPAETPFEGSYVQLTPARHGTDGFFVAILAREATP